MPIIQSANEFVLRKPTPVSLALPWVFIMLPLVLFPSGAPNWAWAKELVGAMSNWIPMIDRMSLHARDPLWTRFALSCLWASGPVWTIVAIIFGIRTLKARIYRQEPVGARHFFGALLLFGGTMLVFATVEPRPWKRFDAFTYFFSDRSGLFLVGWSLITSMFVVIGLVSAVPLSRLFGYKYDWEGAVN